MAEKVSYDYEKNPQGFVPIRPQDRNSQLIRFLSAISCLKAGRVLEIGTGGGRFINAVRHAMPELDLVGIDISKTSINLASQNSNGRIRFLVGDGLCLPFKAESFDAVVIMDVIEHVEDVENLLREVNRVLKKDMLFHAFVPCERNPWTLTWLFRKVKIGSNLTRKHFGHIQYLTTGELENLMAKKGNFRITEKTFSDHLLSQLITLFFLYIPKEILSIRGERTIETLRDSYDYVAHDEKNNLPVSIKILKSLKSVWERTFARFFGLLVFYESEVLKYCPFMAKGVHVTARKGDFAKPAC